MQRPFSNGHKHKCPFECNFYVLCYVYGRCRLPKPTALFWYQNVYLVLSFYLSSIIVFGWQMRSISILGSRSLVYYHIYIYIYYLLYIIYNILCYDTVQCMVQAVPLPCYCYIIIRYLYCLYSIRYTYTTVK
jgi:hypothetical protein